MVLVFSQHARDQMAKRRISEDDVQCALRRRQVERPGDRGNLLVWGYTATGRILKVCITTQNPAIVVTTAWPDEQGGTR